MSENLMDRYSAMGDAEKTAQDADLPPLARQREEEAQTKATAVFDAARALTATGMLKAAGYRVIVKPLDSIMTLETAEAEVAPTLAEKGFEVKTDKEAKREQRGENHGVVIDIGPVAFERLGGRGAWCDEGDIIVFTRYAGTRVEHPPRSGNFYQFINDEDIFGRIV